MKVKNNNENNNIIVLDFGDYEIQKKKKKKPKKKVNNKKKAVDKLKETLQQFDAVLNEAKEKNIEIPKELGELPVNIEDINTIRELNELNADLQQRIINIRELIESGGEPQIPSVQTIDPREFGESGFLQGMTPQPIVVQRQQQGLIEPTKTTTTTQTDKPVEKGKDTDLEKVRQQLKEQEKAIIDKLPPDKREEALKKLKEQASKKPVDTSKEDAEKMGKEDLVKPSLESGFQIIKPDDKRDVKILGESFEAPIGLYDEWETAKGFIEQSSNLGKEDESLPNVVNITVKDFEDFKKEQKAKLDSYTIYVKNLNPTQLKSIQGEMEVPTRISKEILNVYKTDPKKVLEQFYTSKFGRNIKLNVGESGLPKPKPKKPPRQPKGFSGARVPSTPQSVEAEKILEEMLQEIQSLAPDVDVVSKNFTQFRKKQMKIVLEKIKEAGDKNDEEVEFLTGRNNRVIPIETVIGNYSRNPSKLYRGPLLGKIITQYKRVVGTGSYRFQKKRTEAEEQKVSMTDPNMPNPSAGTGASVGRVEFLSDVNS
jgi:hypothetical protein